MCAVFTVSDWAMEGLMQIKNIFIRFTGFLMRNITDSKAPSAILPLIDTKKTMLRIFDITLNMAYSSC